MFEQEDVSLNSKVFSVSDISLLIKNTMEKTFSKVRIRGEISQVTKASSGHIYMTIKDANSSISAIIWRGTRIPFDLIDGTEIIATGKITTYPARSNYQIIVNELELAGIGAILKMLEERKQKFAKMGFFDEANKLQLPKYPEKIGVVTSPTGAAIHDILNRLRDRFPTKVIIWPATVQGETAEQEVADAINGFNLLKDEHRPDVIIVARGGGAIEDLLPFSGEKIIYAVHNSVIPIISGVGHDPDWTLIDFVSDLRAPTPTGAAEKVVPDKITISETLLAYNHRLEQSMLNIIKNNRTKLGFISLKNPQQIIVEKYQRLDDCFNSLNSFMRVRIETLKNKLLNIRNCDFIIKNIYEKYNQKILNYAGLLESYSFKKVLARGYAIIQDSDGSVIKNVKSLSEQDAFSVCFYDGKVNIVPKKN